MVRGLVLFSASLNAQVPQIINYQGKLTTPSGAPVTDTVQMVFTIYDAEVGGNPLWTETQTEVEILKGVFNVLLGSVNPISFSVFDGSIRYLGVQVGGDPEITPRKKIISVGYAYKSFEADTANYARAGAGDNDWTINGNTIYHLSGNVGIGTTSPTEKLDVSGTARLRTMSTGTGTDVVVDANGVLLKKSSSIRYKQNIRGLDSNPDQILQLNPVRFDWKTTGQEDIGLIAEEVEKIVPDLVIYDKEGKPDAVKYDKITIYLLELAKAQQEEINALKAKLEKLESGH